MIPHGISIRSVDMDDIPMVVLLRRRMFESMGIQDENQLIAADKACDAYFTDAIQSGQYHGYLAVTSEGVVVASGGVVVDYHPPGPTNLGGRIGYIMNLFTEPAFRRQGIAREILNRLLEWVQTQGITVSALHATPVGLPLYMQMGYQHSNEMKVSL